MPKRVVEQVSQDALQSVGVALKPRWLDAGRDGLFEVDVVFGCRGLIRGDRF